MKESIVITADEDTINAKIKDVEKDGYEAISITATERYAHKVSVLMQRNKEQ